MLLELQEALVQRERQVLAKPEPQVLELLERQEASEQRERQEVLEQREQQVLV
ncbi:hypothetical protein D3C76_1497910 [compost metagenome]